MNAGSAVELDFWKGRHVLVTGHTGFKGAWLTHWLSRLGAHVTGISLAPVTQPNLFSLLGLQSRCDSHELDICDPQATAQVIQKAQPEVVFHLAAQALVRASYREPLTTFATNVMGTAHVLNALRSTPSARVVVAVTTDKVYRNREWLWPYREDDALGGHDPYSASKAAAEAVIECWRLSFLGEQGVALASARAGNVIGGGDWSEDRLIPDAVRAWSAGQPLSVRRPDAVRPWQHVLEPLAAYLQLAEQLWQRPDLAGAYNFGPFAQDAMSVRQVVEVAKQRFPGAEASYAEQTEGPHEAGLLRLDTSRADQVLGVRPRWNTQQAVERTMDWYRALGQGQPAVALCDADLAAWEQAS
jgi:CDP-glucose 4,6-dehydratase